MSRKEIGAGRERDVAGKNEPAYGSVLRFPLRVSAIFLCMMLSTMGWCSEDPDRQPAQPVEDSLKSASGLPLGEQSPPADAITLSEAVARALLNSPELASFEWKIRGAEARALQAGLRKNPEFSVEVEDVRWRDTPGVHTRTTTIQADKTGATAGIEHGVEYGAGSGFGEAQTTVRLSQVVELGGKRVKRMRLAHSEENLAQWDYETARLNVLTEVAKSFVDVWSAQKRLHLTRDTVTLAEHVVETVAARVEAGKVSPIETAKAEIELSSARIAQAQVQRDLDAARANLAATWAATTPDFDGVLGDLTAIAQAPSFDDLTQLIASNPDLARWSDEMEAREAALNVERSLRAPDMTVTLGFRTTGLSDTSQGAWSLDSAGSLGWSGGEADYSRGRENSLVFDFSLPLPLFDRNQGGIREAECAVSQAAEERRAAEVKAHAALFGAHKTLNEAYHSAVTLRDDVLPRAHDVFERTQEGYRLGKFPYLDMLDAQRALFNVETQYLEALSAYHLTLADMERLIGAPLQDIPEAVQKSESVSEESKHEHP